MSAEHTSTRGVNAYVLVRCEDGQASALVARLQESIGGHVTQVTGKYDVAVLMEADGEEYVAAAVKNHVTSAPGVLAVDVLFWVDQQPHRKHREVDALPETKEININDRVQIVRGYDVGATGTVVTKDPQPSPDSRFLYGVKLDKPAGERTVSGDHSAEGLEIAR